jgi:hypothetical protein
MDQPGFTYWECKDCGFDAVTFDAAMPGGLRPSCPLCAADNGRDVLMSSRVAKDTDKVEGRDARPKVKP